MLGGPLLFVCFAAVVKLFSCQYFPTLHLSSVSCVFSRPSSKKRNARQRSTCHHASIVGQGAQTIPRIRVSARHNSHRQHQGTCLTEEDRDINHNFDTDERLAVVTGDLNPYRAKRISSSWCECAAGHDRVAILKSSDAKSADSLILAQAILAQSHFTLEHDMAAVKSVCCELVCHWLLCPCVSPRPRWCTFCVCTHMSSCVCWFAPSTFCRNVLV